MSPPPPQNPDAAQMWAYAPQIGGSKAIMDVFISGNFKQIKTMQAQANKDLEPLYTKIQKDGINAFEKVTNSNGKQYLSLANGKSKVFIYSKPTTSLYGTSSEPKQAYHVSIGSYSATANFMGISNYVMDNLPMTVAEYVISAAFAAFVSSAISQAAIFTVAAAEVAITEGLAALGVEIAVQIPAAVASGGTYVVVAIIAMLVFFGVQLLLNIIFKKYGLVVTVFNFDKRDWASTSDHYFDNAVIAGGNQHYNPLIVPAFLEGSEANDAAVSSGWDPNLLPIESLVSYATYTIENDNTVFEGLAMSFQMALGNDSSNGFGIKYNIPRFGDNSIGLIDGIHPMKDWITKGKWTNSTHTEKTSNGQSITAFTDYLSGAPENIYHYTINIGNL